MLIQPSPYHCSPTERAPVHLTVKSEYPVPGFSTWFFLLWHAGTHRETSETGDTDKGQWDIKVTFSGPVKINAFFQL